MERIKVQRNCQFTTVQNEIIKDKRLSLAALGLLLVMLSLPEKWNYSVKGLVALRKEKKDFIKKTLNELKSTGYLTVQKLYPNETQSGRFEYLYTVYDVSLFPAKTRAAKQDLVAQALVSQDLVSPPLNKRLNNKRLKNKILNNTPPIIPPGGDTTTTTTTTTTSSSPGARAGAHAQGDGCGKGIPSREECLAYFRTNMPNPTNSDNEVERFFSYNDMFGWDKLKDGCISWQKLADLWISRIKDQDDAERRAGIPSYADCLAYFRENMDDAAICKHEADKFFCFNEAHCWGGINGDAGAWQKLADAWISRIKDYT